MHNALSGRILTKRVGSIRPLVPIEPLRLNADRARWLGINSRNIWPRLITWPLTSKCFRIHIFTGPAVRHEWRADGHYTVALSTAGSVMVAPRGMHATVLVMRSRPAVQWILEFDHAAVALRLEERLNGGHWTCNRNSICGTHRSRGWCSLFALT
jgi:hypothetical protein